MSAIWKDCQMAGFLALGIAGVLGPSRRTRLLGLGALTLATAFRYNAGAATLPLIVLLFEWAPNQRWLRRYATAIGIWVAVMVLSLGVNALLTHRKMYFWYSSMALADIVGTLAMVDKAIPDRELEPVLRPTHILADANLHARIRGQYRSDDFQQLITGDGHLWDVQINGTIPTPAAQREAIAHAWKYAVTTYPGAYVRYRLENFGETLGVNRHFGGGTVVTHSGQYVGMLDYMGVQRGWSRFQAKAERVTLWSAKRTQLFRPHLYALISLALLWFARRQRDVLALLLSGLGMELSMLPLGATPDFRYSHWLVVCTCIAFVMMIARRYRDGAIARD
jgi:hypothetical protein